MINFSKRIHKVEVKAILRGSFWKASLGLPYPPLSPLDYGSVSNGPQFQMLLSLSAWYFPLQVPLCKEQSPSSLDWWFLSTRRIRYRQSHLPPGLCLSPLILRQPEVPRAEATYAGPMNTGLAGSKAAFLLPARFGVYGSQRPGMGETTTEGLSGFLSLEWHGWKQD